MKHLLKRSTVLLVRVFDTMYTKLFQIRNTGRDIAEHTMIVSTADIRDLRNLLSSITVTVFPQIVSHTRPRVMTTCTVTDTYCENKRITA